MKKLIFLSLLMGAVFTSCNQNSAEEEKYRKEVAELDSIQNEMENAVQELKEIEAEMAEVDSLLNDI